MALNSMTWKIGCICWERNPKVKYWLTKINEQRRIEIAMAGEQLALNHHSFNVRVTELWEMLGINVFQEESWRW